MAPTDPDDGDLSGPGLRVPWARSDRPVPRRVVRPLQEFLQASTSGGILLVAAAVVALVWANSGAADCVRAALADPTELRRRRSGHLRGPALLGERWIDGAFLPVGGAGDQARAPDRRAAGQARRAPAGDRGHRGDDRSGVDLPGDHRRKRRRARLGDRHAHRYRVHPGDLGARLARRARGPEGVRADPSDRGRHPHDRGDRVLLPDRRGAGPAPARRPGSRRSWWSWSGSTFARRPYMCPWE